MSATIQLNKISSAASAFQSAFSPFPENWLICRRGDFTSIVLTTTGYGKGLMEFSSI
jgi:hypothetical protein